MDKWKGTLRKTRSVQYKRAQIHRVSTNMLLQWELRAIKRVILCLVTSHGATIATPNSKSKILLMRANTAHMIHHLILSVVHRQLYSRWKIWKTNSNRMKGQLKVLWKVCRKLTPQLVRSLVRQARARRGKLRKIRARKRLNFNSTKQKANAYKHYSNLLSQLMKNHSHRRKNRVKRVEV